MGISNSACPQLNSHSPPGEPAPPSYFLLHNCITISRQMGTNQDHSFRFLLTLITQILRILLPELFSNLFPLLEPIITQVKDFIIPPN